MLEKGTADIETDWKFTLCKYTAFCATLICNYKDLYQQLIRNAQCQCIHVHRGSNFFQSVALRNDQRQKSLWDSK